VLKAIIAKDFTVPNIKGLLAAAQLRVSVPYEFCLDSQSLQLSGKRADLLNRLATAIANFEISFSNLHAWNSPNLVVEDKVSLLLGKPGSEIEFKLFRCTEVFTL
jgi:hypothetical protein